MEAANVEDIYQGRLSGGPCMELLFATVSSSTTLVTLVDLAETFERLPTRSPTPAKSSNIRRSIPPSFSCPQRK